MPVAEAPQQRAHLWVVRATACTPSGLWDMLRAWGFEISFHDLPPQCEADRACVVIYELANAEQARALCLQQQAPKTKHPWIALCDPVDTEALTALVLAGMSQHHCPALADALLRQIGSTKALQLLGDQPPLVALLGGEQIPGLEAALEQQGLQCQNRCSLSDWLGLVRETAPALMIVVGNSNTQALSHIMYAARQQHRRRLNLSAIIWTDDTAPGEDLLEASDLLLRQSEHSNAEMAALLARRAWRGVRESAFRRHDQQLERCGNQWLMAREHLLVTLTDINGKRIYVSEKLCERTGYSAAELLGQSVEVITHMADIPSIRSTLSHQHSWNGMLETVAANGEQILFETHVIPLLNELGEVHQYLGLLTDVTESHRLQQQALQQNNELQSILDAIPAMVLQKDRQGKIIRVNQTAAQVMASQREQMEGRAVDDVFTRPDNHRLSDNIILEHRTPVNNIIDQHIHPDGRTVWMRTDKTPLLGPDGEVSSIVSCVFDVTEQQRTLAALAESAERLHRSQSYAQVGTWDWDLQTQEVHISEEYASVCGLPPGTKTIHKSALVERMPPEDHQVMIQTFLGHQNSGEQQPRFEADHRLIMPDGSLRWVQQRGNLLRDNDGRPLRLMGICQDITRRKLAEAEAERQSQLLAVLHTAASRYVESLQAEETSSFLISALLKLTGSSFGFIAEVLPNEHEAPALRIVAAGALDPEENVHCEKLIGKRLASHDAFVQQIMVQSPALLASAEAECVQEIGKALPAFKQFMGIPIFRESALVGMLAIANRDGGFSEALVDFLAPFCSTCGVLIHASQMEHSRQAQQLALRQAKEDAESANRAKSNFLSSMSHELRTPLNAILGFAQLMDPEQLASEQRTYVQQIEQAGWHLLELINDVLDLARIESGRLQLQQDAIALDELLRECTTLVKPLAEQHGVDLRYVSPPAGGYLAGDRTRIRQILINLLSNAIKYNRRGGWVDLKVDESPLAAGPGWQIEIRDSGMGMNAEQLSQLFEPFNRLGAEKLGIEGTGIGLAITQRLLQLMHSDLQVESKLGQGSRFWFTLPSAEPAMNIEPLAAPIDSFFETTAVTARTVLYVEDNATNLFLVEKLLRRLPGVTLLCASTAAEGLALAEATPPDLLLLDIQLPDMNGYQLLHQLRQRPATQHTPAIALSANAMPKDIAMGLEAGFAEYMTKPLQVTAFLTSIGRALACTVKSTADAESTHQPSEVC